MSRSTISRSRRGAARVSAVWLISVGVVTLAALAFGFISQSEVTAARELEAKAKDASTEATTAADELREVKRNLSTTLGWYDRTNVDPVSDPEAAKSAIADLQSTFSDLTDTDKDFETVLPKVISAYNTRGTENGTLRTRIESLEGELTSARASLASVEGAKDATITQLRGQLADEQQSAQQRQSELEDRLGGVQGQLADRDAELRTLRSEVSDKERNWDQERKVAEGQIVNLQNTARFATEEFANNPDGEIIDVSTRLPYGWINIGSNQRLTRGMTFRIEGGPPGRTALKGWGKVITVEANRAEIEISNLTNRYDPIVKGDVIINPLYDPVGGRNAVLAGSFSGSWSHSELVTLLGNVGINVQDAIDETTHFLIVGNTLYNDPETNEPLEEPLDVKDLAEYKEAEVRHIQIIPIQDIRTFFKVGS